MKRPLLLPLVPLYAASLALRELRLERGWEAIRRLRDPVISIGNLSTGGSGKTPLATALARLLTARGVHVDVLSRGYGRRSAVPLRVDPDGSADEYGDEPVLMARATGVPVYVAAERFDAGELAEADAANDPAPRVHILDDGFQHRQLARDLDVLLLRESDLHDFLLPGGDLREPLKALNRATVIAVQADEPEVERFLTERVAIDRNSEGARRHGAVWRVRRRMEIPRVEGPVTAFCGIARAEQFFAGLGAAGMTLASHHAFADHHRYTMSDVDRLVAKARSSGSVALITTGKDEVRLGDLVSAFPPALPLKTAGLSVEIEDERAVLGWIEEKIAPRSTTAGNPRR